MRSKEVNDPVTPRSVQTEVQTIAGEIAHCPISPRKYQLLSRKLDHALETLKDLETDGKAKNVFAKAQTEQLKEQVVKLYGDLENGLVQREVSQIQEESTSLRKGRLTLKAVKKLETHIHELERNHMTLIPDRRIVADAKQVLLEAKARLSGKPVVRHIDMLAGQKNVRFVEETPLLPDEVEELFDVARAVYNRDFRLAKMRYASLSSSYKDRFEEHMKNLLAVPFDDAVETCQALIATANELVGNGEGYPTSNEIDQLFLGLAQCTDDDDKPKLDGKIVSFPH